MSEKPKAPICPYCEKPLIVVLYEGYYESFPYWACDCDDEFLKTQAEHMWHGDNA